VLVGVLSLIFVGLRTIFAVYFVVDQGASPLTALREGWKLSRGLEWRIGLFCLVLLIINLMGLSLAIVGLLITLPLTQLAFALLYRELQGASQEDELPSEEVSEAPMLTQSESS
jgi:uncharacterized membrane protein